MSIIYKELTNPKNAKPFQVKMVLKAIEWMREEIPEPFGMKRYRGRGDFNK